MGADVLVIGAGPAGTATAIALRQAGLAVVVVERSAAGELRVGETFPPVIREPLAHLGVWERFMATCPNPSFASRSVWGRAVPHDNDFLFHPHGMGWHVDRPGFDALLARAAEDAGARLLVGSRLATLVRDGDVWTASLRGPDSARAWSCTARVVVDATGRRASVARRLGARRILHDRLVGAVAFCDPGEPAAAREAHTLVEAVETGWWYSAPLPDGRLVLAYMTDTDLHARAGAGRFQDRLAEAAETSQRARHYGVERARPRLFPAGVSRLDRAAGPGWLAVGDAAATLDPLSSLGVHAALTGGIRAAEAIAATLGASGARPLTLDDYAHHVQESAADHLVARAGFYAAERRWPDAPFWRRRHRDEVAAAAAVRAMMLHPAQVLRLAGAHAARAAFHGVAALIPAVDIQLLLHPLAAGPQTAAALAGAYRAATPRRGGDRTVVESLAMLLRYQIVESVLPPLSAVPSSTSEAQHAHH